MNSLLDKVSTLVEINVRSLIGQSHRSKNAASFFRHYMSVEQNLINVEKAVAHVETQMEVVVQRGRRSEEQVAQLDRIVDDFLLNGDESSARKAQIQWNDAKRINIKYRAQIKDLDLERDKLLRGKDKLEVQLELMKNEKERLQELYRRYKEDHSGTPHGDSNDISEEKVYWVVDPL